MNILLTSSARRIDFVDFFYDALRNAGMKGKVIVADPELNAPSLQTGDESYVIPHQTDTHFIDEIIEICKQQKIDCLVPLNDLEVPKISAYKDELERLGVSVFVPDLPVVNKVRDKGKYRELLKSFDVMAPRSYLNLENAEKALADKEVSFPLIVKPRNGSASIGIEFVQSVEGMKIAYDHAVKEIKESSLNEATYKKPEDNVIIQEVIEGKKFSVDMFNDLEGNHLASFVRKQLAMRGGDVDRSITVNDPELQTMAERMGKNLGHAGYMNADVYYDGMDYYVIDINPRFGGGYSFTHKAGANIPAAIIALAADKEINEDWLTQESGMELARHDTVVHIDSRKVKDISRNS
jgi:carbamoyl-phosphate synthase large subunit